MSNILVPKDIQQASCIIAINTLPSHPYTIGADLDFDSAVERYISMPSIEDTLVNLSLTLLVGENNYALAA